MRAQAQRAGRRRVPRRALPTAAALGLIAASLLAAVAGAAGPPFPNPVGGQAVYDTAGALREATIAKVETTIDAIEARTGAEIAVYTQLTNDDVTTEQAEGDAQALMDQWGVGRKGIDDGLVILFDLEQSDPCHGQVQLYAGPGYRATYLDNGERQAIYENDMLPLLRGCDLDGALLAAMAKIDAAATPEHANTLSFYRQVNAVIGLLVAPLLLVLIIGWGLLSWFRHGRDPVYLDDPSIHIPAAPKGLTPAAGAVMRDGKSDRRALTTASLDLAARGLITFRPEPGGLLGKPKIGIQTGGALTGDAAEQARILAAQHRPIDEATSYVLGRLEAIAGGDGYIEPDKIVELGSHVATFDKKLETHVVEQGWFTERPAQASTRWNRRGFLVLVLGIVAGVIGWNVPAQGLVVLGVALVVAGVALLVLAASMPSRTMPGAMIRAMLEAYRRTLEKTMAQARSMGDVVTESAIPLIESPDDAVVWGVALGLQSEVERVLERTADDLRTGRVQSAYVPLWYGGFGGGQGAPGGGSGGWAPGLMSSSPIPDFGGMMAALGTIGNSPSSSGSGGGFSGGGSGGGGGGAGGGF